MIKRTGIFRENLMFYRCFSALQGQGRAKILTEDKVNGLSGLWERVTYNFIYLMRGYKKVWDGTYRSSGRNQNRF